MPATLEELAFAVKEMRDLQNRYFRSAMNRNLLSEARSQERKVDRLVDEILNPPMKSLFDFIDESETQGGK